ncbi:hypothetical protein D3C71_1269290 [compost metagenome]
MLIAYFDEVKYQKNRSPYYWLGAIVADSELIWKLEENVNALASEHFGTKELTKQTEFHATDILSGNGHFADVPFRERIELMTKLISIFGNADELGKIYVQIDPALMAEPDDIEGKAFMFLVERVDSYLLQMKQRGMLIGDHESEKVSGQFADSLSSYRAKGTKYDFGKSLKYLLDTVHFTRSHHSRMLQLADLYVWMRQFREAGANGKWHRQQILDHIASIDGCLRADRFKNWPTEQSWWKPKS